MFIVTEYAALKTYAAISNAHLSRFWKRLGPVFRPLTDSDQHSFPTFLCHIGVPTFSWQNKVIKVCQIYLLTSNRTNRHSTEDR